MVDYFFLRSVGQAGLRRFDPLSEYHTVIYRPIADEIKALSSRDELRQRGAFLDTTKSSNQLVCPQIRIPRVEHNSTTG